MKQDSAWLYSALSKPPFTDPAALHALLHRLQMDCALSNTTTVDGIRFHDGEQTVLELHFSSRHALKSVEPGEAWTPERAGVLRRMITDAVGQTYVYRVLRTVVLSNTPVTGSWRFKDRVQLLPAPAEFPSSHEFVAGMGLWPNILEVRVRTSQGDDMGYYARADLRETVLVLSALLRSRLWRPETGPAWFFDPLRYSEGSRLAYLGFLPPSDFASQAETLSSHAVPHLRVVEASDFYGGGLAGLAQQQEFTVPKSLPESLLCFEGLEAPDRRDFLTACHWLEAARRARAVSMSLSMVSVVTALEALLPETSDHCSECNAHLPSIRSRIRDLLDLLGPNLDEDARRRILGLYDHRSALVHGASLWDDDLEALAAGPTKSHAEMNLAFLAWQVVPAVLVSWLHSRSDRHGSG